MKSLSQYLLACCTGLCLVFGSASCSDDFLSDPPEGYLPPDSLITTAQDARELLNAAYGPLRSGGFYGGQLWLLSELMADHLNGNVDALTNGDWRAHYTRTTDIFLGTTRSLMEDGSRAVGRSNLLLRNIDAIPDLGEDERNRMKAECKFLRAICQFELVRMFAQPYGYSADNGHLGIAIHKDYNPAPVNRSSVAAVYADIIEQLTQAANELPAQNGVYATSWAAKGYLAKVYFQMNDFANAYAFADDVIQNGPFSFDDSLGVRFSNFGTNEAVFQVVSNQNIGINGNAGNALRSYFRPDPSIANRSQVFVADDHYTRATGSPLDWRGQNWYQQNNVAGINYVFCTKFPLEEIFNIPTCHLTELMLIRAECAAETGNLVQAAADVSRIRVRAGLGSLSDGLGQSLLIQAVRNERELELFMEGNRLHELKRRAIRDGSNLLIRNAPWNCPGMVCQLPDSELSGNPDMEPNPQGGCN